MKTRHIYYVYIITNKIRGTLYIGMTNDLHRRIYEHKTGLVEGFSKKYKLYKLVYFEEIHNVKEVIVREKRLKKWNRLWKIELIEKQNKEWLDLALDFYNDI